MWIIDDSAALEIYDCDGLMCGRIIWLLIPRDPQGELNLDKRNPAPALRTRPLCGLTILKGLHPAGKDLWKDGWFYNPNDGVTYRVNAQLRSDDVLIARVYVRLPVFGKTKTLKRVVHGTSEGWC